MILGLDISTSITGVTVINENGKIVLNEAIDTRKYKDFFEKAQVVESYIKKLKYKPKAIYIEQSLQSFRSGFSSAKTLSSLSRFNGIVSWLLYSRFSIKPEYIAATSARKLCNIKIPRGTKAKQVVIQHVIDNVPDVTIVYTKNGNPKPECYDKADSWVIAKAGYLCQSQKNSKS
jgi:Holliday junction resolvasome RuvABC endonuclease subunit